MAKAKKKTATRTAKKSTRSTKASGSRCRGSKAARKTTCSNRERNHIYFVTAMSMIVAILLCASAAMLMV